MQVNISLSGPSKLETLGRCNEGGTIVPSILEEGGTDGPSVIEEGGLMSLASLKRVNFLKYLCVIADSDTHNKLLSIDKLYKR